MRELENCQTYDVGMINSFQVNKNDSGMGQEKSYSNFISMIRTIRENNELDTSLLKEVDIKQDSTIVIERRRAILPKVLHKKSISNSFYTELKEYNGIVSFIDNLEGKFIAKMTNVLDNDDLLQAKFNISDVRRDDQPLLRDGALFIWQIGKEETDGTLRNISQLVFRRLPTWSRKIIEEAEQVAKRYAEAIQRLELEDTTE